MTSARVLEERADAPVPAPRPDTIPDAMARAAAGAAGLTFTDSKLRTRHYSYRELVRSGRTVAAALAARGITRGDVVCFLAQTEPGLVTSLLGVWELGVVPNLLPFPRKLGEAGYLEEVARRLRISAAKAIIVSDDVAPLLQDLALPVPVLRFQELTAHEEVRSIPAVSGEDIALLQFTSGTTALARAVPVTHRQLLHNTTSVAGVLTPQPGDVLVSWLPLYHDMGIISLVGTIAEGKSVVIMSPDEFLRRPGAWLEALHAFRGTATIAPNFAYGLAARDLARRKPDGLDLSRVRCAMNGAEPIDLETLDAFAAAAAPYGFRRDAICPMYGQAEATLAVTVTSPFEPLRDIWVARASLEPGGRPEVVAAGSPNSRRLAACGRPITDTEVTVVGAGGTSLPPGSVGQIAVRGPGVMSGYWFEPDADGDKLVGDGWLLSGDLGFEWQDQWFICGRIKDMMIVGGRNFYPEDYESIADHVPGVRFGHTAAFYLPEVERMVLVAELRAPVDRAGAIAGDVLEAVRAKLNHAPHRVVLVAPRALPRTSSGKRQRQLCKYLYLDGRLPVLGEAG
jgi:fatty-acyl-CoA synthase